MTPQASHFKKALSRLLLPVPALLFSLAACAGEPERLFIIGQDLGSVRGYMDSDCCPQPDGNTAYLSFYNLMSPEAGFGGIGMDNDGNMLEEENDWGGGSANLWKSSHEFGPMALAIGLSITENDHPGALDRLAGGEYDENIRKLARFFNSIDNTVYLRIGYEFDGIWNQGYHDPERFVTVWKRIVDGLRAEGVSNVKTVWQAAVFPMDEMLDGHHDNLPDWYPGDDYVDWMGYSAFVGLDEKPGIEVESLPPTSRELVGELLDFARERNKPVMIAEASPQSYDLLNRTKAFISYAWDGQQGEGKRQLTDDEIWDGWFAPLFEYMNENRDVIQALAYINCHWDAQEMWGPPYESGYWGDTRLEVNPELAKRFTTAIEDWKAGK